MALPNDEVKLRALIAELKTHGRLLFVVDHPSTISALPAAVAHTEGVLFAYSSDGPCVASLICTPAKPRPMPETPQSSPKPLVRCRIPCARDQLAELTMLCGFDDDLAALVTQTSNLIRGLLTQIHPAFERVRTAP